MLDLGECLAGPHILEITALGGERGGGRLRVLSAHRYEVRSAFKLGERAIRLQSPGLSSSCLKAHHSF